MCRILPLLQDPQSGCAPLEDASVNDFGAANANVCEDMLRYVLECNDTDEDTAEQRKAGRQDRQTGAVNAIKIKLNLKRKLPLYVPPPPPPTLPAYSPCSSTLSHEMNKKKLR